MWCWPGSPSHESHFESHIWRGIIGILGGICLRGLRWNVGNGLETRFWLDRWLFSRILLVEVSIQPVSLELLELLVFFLCAKEGWKLFLFQHLLPEEVLMEMVSMVPYDEGRGPNVPTWADSSNGCFSTRTCFSASD